VKNHCAPAEDLRGKLPGPSNIYRAAVFFATYHARHTGEGGPVPPTQKETHSQYVYILTMDADNKVAKMVKVWNAPWALKELGWA
jgi:hypothetical protein